MSVTEGGDLRLQRLAEIQGETEEIPPKLVQGNREFEPLAVTRLGGTLAWDTDSEQLQCGNTVTDTNGDENIRLDFEAVCTHTQFETLQSMRANPDDVKLISNPYSGVVTFDQLKFDQLPDANGAVVRGDTNTDEPIYQIQLQSKEESDG